jgi:hypothetical protein
MARLYNAACARDFKSFVLITISILKVIIIITFLNIL